jgi:hypothetical protein
MVLPVHPSEAIAAFSPTGLRSILPGQQPNFNRRFFCFALHFSWLRKKQQPVSNILLAFVVCTEDDVPCLSFRRVECRLPVGLASY